MGAKESQPNNTDKPNGSEGQAATKASNSQPETFAFQAQVDQLLKLMIHSLYSNREIFLRELISNASDACDKLRFEAVQNDSLYEGDSALRVRITLDEAANTLTISDSGIGMSRQEVADNIGMIARSGTRQFVESMTGDAAKDSNLIGQFGVGFYSSFIVADEVVLVTRRAGEPANAATEWRSQGAGEYHLNTVEKPERGTDVILHLKPDASEFLQSWRLQSLIKQYSDHIMFPIEMPIEVQPDAEPEADAESDADAPVADATPAETTWEQVNLASALWTCPKRELSDDDYKGFYKQICHDPEDPLLWSHNRVEGTQDYTFLLYIPARAPFDLYERESKQGVRLYVQRVFIMEERDKLLPQYLRFVRGVIDSSDLPLNVSREILQNNKLLDAIRKACVHKVLGLLEGAADNDPELYAKIWEQFGRVLKEGPAEDYANRDQLLKLMRFASTDNDTPEQTVTLQDYVTRMLPEQKAIYYITADSHASAKSSPHLEFFRSKGIEVLLLSDRVDEWLMSRLDKFADKDFVSVSKGDLDLSSFKADTPEEKSADDEQGQALVQKIQDALGDQVDSVRVSTRLVSSPACLVLGEHDMALYMQQLMKQAGHSMPAGKKPVLEINPQHPILRRLDREEDESRFSDWSRLLLDQAHLAEGGQLENGADFVARLNDMLVAMDSA